jgi:predicted nucleotide-binding protein
MTKKTSGKRNEIPVIPRTVDAQTGIVLLKKLIDKASELQSRPNLQSSDVDAWRATARDYLVRAFGSESPNVNSVLHASGDGSLFGGMSDEEFTQYLRSGMANKIKMLESCIEQLETEIQLAKPSETSNDKIEASPISNRVFVVHGHDQGVKEAVARFLEKLDLEPVILHEKPNAGRTIIEKFSDYSDVHFAVVLLTGDDEGKSRGSSEALKLRARQNVFLELGYFLGKLGRARVCALHEDGVEIPSDYQGVLFVPLDKNDKWKYDLVTELKAAGFSVDANRIFSAD